MPASDRILILGGTADARALAALLVARGFDVTTSLAGVTSEPLLPAGEVRSGGFGGADGLAAYLRENGIGVLLDATHPFAAQMSAHAALAAQATATRLLRLERPAWEQQQGDVWVPAENMEKAVSRLPQGARVLVTTGRKGLAPLLARRDLSGVIRTIEPPAEMLPPQWSVLRDRPPYETATELRLLREEHITHLLTKNAGGDATAAKLVAAREAGIPVIMIERPAKPECPVFSSADALGAALK